MPEEYKIRRSKTMKEKRAIHPEFWDGQVESLYKRWEDPIEKEKQSQRSKELWKNPDYRKKMVDTGSKSKGRRLTDETKQKLRESAIQQWQDPVFRNSRIKPKQVVQQKEEPIYRNKQWLEDQYINQDKSIYDIENETGYNHATIWNWIKRHGITVKKKFTDTLDNPDWLVHEYLDLHKTAIQIAKEIKCSDAAVLDHLKKIGIQTRTPSGKSKNEAFKDKNWLYNQYWNLGKTQPEIASENSVSSSCIFYWMNYHNIKTRSPSEMLSGSRNPRWLGGKSFEPYCPKFTKDLKEEVRNKFDRKCVRCGRTEEKSRKLCVHHINFDKKSGCYGKKWNLAPVCINCHNWTTQHRFESFNMFNSIWILNTETNFNIPIFTDLNINYK